MDVKASVNQEIEQLQSLYKVNMAIYKAFKQNGINIPFHTHNIVTHG